MNSMSRPHCNDERDDCSKRNKEAEVLLKYKPSNPVSVRVTTDEAETRIASLSLNTKKFCLSYIKFEFSVNLISTFDENASILTVNFQLYRLCRGETVPTEIGNPWSYSCARSSADIITFIHCDCDCVNDDCCTYYVKASYVSTLSNVTLNFNNPTLSALVVEKNIPCC